jgi:hypothetical protein
MEDYNDFLKQIPKPPPILLFFFISVLYLSIQHLLEKNAIER